MKRIVLLIDSLIGGGAETTNLRLAKIFLDNDYAVTVIIMKNIIEIDYDKRIELICLNYTKKKLSSLFQNYFYAYKLHKVLSQRNNTDLIIGSLGLTHKLMHIIEHKHTFYYALHGATTKAKLDSKKGLNYFLKKRELIKLYNQKHLICVSKSVKDDILSLPIFPKTIDVIYNPFDFNEIRAKAEEHINFEFPDEYIVHVGRFAKVKRHDILIKAFSLIENHNIKLVLVGEGEEKECLKELVENLNLQNRVIFAGFQKNPYPIIKNAKLLVLSSENEGFGNVIIEALVLEIKTISTMCEGPSEILSYMKLNDLLVNKNDIHLLKEKINTYLSKKIYISENLLNIFNEKEILKKYFNIMKP
jgi:glycosyltransferase involved in cell wall biosynthesis